MLRWPLLMRKTKYKTLHEWLDRTGTNQTQLIEMVKEQTGRDMSHALMSMILRGSKRCSKWNAWAIHIVTGVPMETLTKWPPSRNPDLVSGGSPKGTRRSLREDANVA